jgi:DMSO reductase anchor subunit
MAQLKNKVQNALNEGRMLILGSQVLLGFQFRSVFEPGFDKLPEHSQYLKLVGLALMLISIALLMWPAAYHRIVADGEDTEDVHSFTSTVMDWALLPFALGLSLDIFTATEKVAGETAAIVSGIIGGLVALTFWYGFPFIRRGARAPRIKEKQEMDEQKQESEESKVTDKIKHVLTEARMVLPGAQALLGFQLVTFLMEAFEKLPASSKYIHLVSLALVALSIVLLMTPAAYHRIVERGEETEHFHRFASRILVAAMVPLALGVCGDLFVVARKVTSSAEFALAASVFMLFVFYGLWFGFTVYLRGKENRAGRLGKPLSAD